MLKLPSAGLPRRWLRLPRRTIRLRLTALYAALFLASGAGLLAVTYVLVDQHTPMAVGFRSRTSGGQLQVQTAADGGAAVRGSSTAGKAGRPPPGACVSVSPLPALSPGSRVKLADPFPPSGTKAAQCAWVQAQVNAAREGYLTSLLTDSGIALGVMAIAALGLGWLVSGRVLRPLRTITLKAQQISASNLHERLALGGPDDELKDLGDTMDGLLARLETAFSAQRQFVANASHELRTPLARQQAMVEVALANPDRSVSSLAEVCQRVLAAGQQQEQLIEGLLTLARSQRGLDRLEPVDLAAIASATVASRSADARQRDIQVMLLDGPAIVAGDARLAERLATNLLDNAIRHNHAHGTVLVRTFTDDRQAGLSVVNTGPVLDPGEVPGLFEPFRRRGVARTATTTADRGLGLGLSIVAAIARAHGAELQSHARPGGGLEVTVRFERAERVAKQSGHADRILEADDRSPAVRLGDLRRHAVADAYLRQRPSGSSEPRGAGHVRAYRVNEPAT
ncbi:MAG: HAMP domain-containing histidine kinase [Actinobacteria bacterium]|nr:HAMP domain-containing histidine kinase [Actinomycetota bacterium]